MSLKTDKAADRALLEALAARLSEGKLDRDFGGVLHTDGLKATVSVRLERILPTDQNAEHRKAALAMLTRQAEGGATEFHCGQSIKRRGWLSSSVCSKNIAFALVRPNRYRPAENGEFDYVCVCGTHRNAYDNALACIPIATADLKRIRELGRRRDGQRRWAERLLVRDPHRMTCQMFDCEAPTDHVQMADVWSRFAAPDAAERAQLDAACNFYCKDHRAAETANLPIVFQFSDWTLEDIQREIARNAEQKRKAEFSKGLRVVP